MANRPGRDVGVFTCERPRSARRDRGVCAASIGLSLCAAAMFAVGCLPVEPSDADDAQEAVVHHFAQQVEDGPWDVICLRREAEAAQESEASYLRRFEGHRPPVVPVHLCAAAGDERYAWIIHETGDVAFEIILGHVRRNRDGSLLVSAATSTGTIDYTEYDCTLLQRDGAWRVEECVVTITT